MPVGSIYLSVNGTNPSTLFGGTWEQIKDKFLLCAGSNYGNGTTGGSATHLHSTANHTLTIDQIPSHKHGVGYYNSAGNYVPKGSTAFLSFRYQSDIYTPSINGGLTDMSPTGYTQANFIQAAGGGTAHNHGNTGSSSNLPPYIAVTVWKRVS